MHILAEKFYHITPEGSVRILADFAEALSCREQGGYLWLNFVDPAKAELSTLIEPFGIHELCIEDCLDDEQIPKIDDYPSNTFVLLNRLVYDQNVLHINEIDLMLGKDFIILVTHKLHNMETFFARLAEQVQVNIQAVKKGPDFLMHVIVDHIVDGKFHAIDVLQDELDAVEEQIINDISNFKPESLMILRRHILSLRKCLTHEREILIKICRKDSPFISESAIYHFRDIYDHLVKFYEFSEISREMISSFMEIYLSMMNTKISILSNKTNLVVRRLTLITTIFMPLTFLSGIGGMSEWSMMTGPANWKVSYPLFILAMIVIGTISYYLLKRYEAKDESNADAGMR